MFTGIIRGLGAVVSVADRDKFREIVVDVANLVTEPKIGASVAISGTCLTITKVSTRPLDHSTTLTFDVMEESLKKTTTGDLKVADKVCIEPSMRAGDEIGGHFVLGHIDGVGEVIEKAQDGENTRMRFRAPAALSPYIVDKGSIAIDGISLTVCDTAPSNSPINGGGSLEFDVWLLPLTLERTTLGFKNPGDRINLEADYLLKAILRAKLA